MVVATDAIVITMPDTLILLCLFILIFSLLFVSPPPRLLSPLPCIFYIIIAIVGYDTRRRRRRPGRGGRLLSGIPLLSREIWSPCDVLVGFVVWAL